MTTDTEDLNNEEVNFTVIEDNIKISNFLLEKFKQLFPKEEHLTFIKESLTPRPTIIRTNTLKIRPSALKRLLSARGMQLDSVHFCESAFIVYKTPVPIGATPEYLAGYYVIQGGSSFLPVLTMNIQPNDSVIDLCSAPGMKSSHIACFLNKDNYFIANDSCKDRLFAVKGNLSRLGITNVVIVNYDARSINLGKFDKISLDAPCSGTGIISKDRSVLVKETVKSLVLCQKELMVNAYSMLKKGGVLVYSTCSVLVEENEEVVDYLLNKFNDLELLPVEEKIGKDGFVKFRGKRFNKNMGFTKRVYPHVNNLDGFFVAKIIRK